MKIKFKKLIFKLGLATFFETLNFFRERIKNRRSNKRFLAEHPDILLPPDFYIYETFTLDYKKYYSGGFETAQWIYNQLNEFISFKNISVLDWGCGPARVLRHLPVIAGEKNQYFGCDYNSKYVDWCSKNIHGIKFYKNDLSPPLDYDSNCFNAIYGISIFTHLSEEMHYKWMSELTRVLSQGGVLLITTHGDIMKNKLSNQDKENFDKGNLVVHSYKKEGNRLFASYQPPTFFSSLCLKHHLSILKHIPGEMINDKPQQDVWILKKIK